MDTLSMIDGRDTSDGHASEEPPRRRFARPYYRAYRPSTQVARHVVETLDPGREARVAAHCRRVATAVAYLRLVAPRQVADIDTDLRKWRVA